MQTTALRSCATVAVILIAMLRTVMHSSDLLRTLLHGRQTGRESRPGIQGLESSGKRIQRSGYGVRRSGRQAALQTQTTTHAATERSQVTAAAVRGMRFMRSSVHETALDLRHPRDPAPPHAPSRKELLLAGLEVT